MALTNSFQSDLFIAKVFISLQVYPVFATFAEAFHLHMFNGLPLLRLPWASSQLLE